MTDERLLADFLTRRDASAFEALVRRHGPMVLRACRDLLGDWQDAEDAFQATFLVLLRQAGSIRRRGSLGPWLYEVACRISRRERRRLARLRSQERQASEMDASAPPDSDPADRELKPILHDEIGRLPSRLRDAIVLCYFEGLKVDEAAGRLGCPVGTLKSRLGKGRELLRDRLTRRGLAASALLLLMFSLTEEASAAPPGPLLDSTVGSGTGFLGGVRVSRKVASMMLREEAGRRRVRLAVSWGLLLGLLLILGAWRLVPPAREAEAVPAPAGPGIAASVYFSDAPGAPSLFLPGEHCRAR